MLLTTLPGNLCQTLSAGSRTESFCLIQAVLITSGHKQTQGSFAHHHGDVLLTLEAALLTMVSLGMLYGKALKPNVLKVTVAPPGACFLT